MRLVRPIVTAAILAFSAGVAACKEQSEMDTYSKDQITEISAAAVADGVEVSVRPILETMHYLAGAMLAERDGQRVLTLVRCGLKGKCPADLPAELLEGGVFRITLDGADSPVAVTYEGGETERVFTP